MPARAGRRRSLLGARPVRGRARSCTSAVDALDRVSAGAFVGSLVAVLVLVAVPVLLLGAVAPYAIRLAVTRGRGGRHGRRAGCTRSRPPARSSGTFLSALLLIPLIGTRRTFLVFALALALVAALGLRGAAGRSCRAGASPALLRSRSATIKAADDGRR